MKRKRIIVVGAGLGGLSAACYAAMNGYETLVLERNRGAGGLVASWKRKDYVVDGGVHFWTGYRPGAAGNELYQDLGIARACRFKDLSLYCRMTDQQTGDSLDITDNIEKFQRDLKVVARSDFEKFDPVVKGAGGLMDQSAMDAFFEKPIEICGALEKLKLMWDMRDFLRLFRGVYRKPVRDYSANIKDPRVRFILDNMFSPEVSVLFLCWILAGLFSKQYGLLDGCSTSATSAMESRLDELGGEIIYNAPVAKITAARDRVVGVVRENNMRHDADIVISACDAYSTIYDLLGGRYSNPAINGRFRSWKTVSPMVMVSLGVDRHLEDQPWLQMVRLKNPIMVSGDETPAITIRTFNYCDRFAPSGKTVVQVSFDSDWSFWRALSRDTKKYRDEKSRIAEEVSDRLEEMYPGIYGQIEMTDVASPFTTWKRTRNHRGSYMGWVPTAGTMTAAPLRTLPGLDGLYMAGQWVMGGGVLPSLYSGKQAIQLICHRDGKPFIRSMT
jgi:phytoene dehydrogenase-like protein